MNTYKEIKEAIINNDLTQLELNNIIKLAEWKRKKGNHAKFNCGQQVYFFHKGEKVRGTVAKIMKKNIKVAEFDKPWLTWTVSPGLLKFPETLFEKKVEANPYSKNSLKNISTPERRI